MRQLVIGDIHGAYAALMQVLDRARFDDNVDQLITLGDLVDGGPETKRLISELLTIKNAAHVKGNHDNWFHDALISLVAPEIWTTQGGEATLYSYGVDRSKPFADEILTKVPFEHVGFFERQKHYHKAGKDLFVHGGIDPTKSVVNQPFIGGRRLGGGGFQGLAWDRELVTDAFRRSAQGRPPRSLYGGLYQRVFVGHTPVSHFVRDESPASYYPGCFGNVIAMDTGAGWPGGKLSAMDVDTGEVFQSDFVHALYPDWEWRRGY